MPFPLRSIHLQVLSMTLTFRCGFWKTGSAEVAAPLAFSFRPCVISHSTCSPDALELQLAYLHCTLRGWLVPFVWWINTHLLENTDNLAMLTQKELTACSPSLSPPCSWELKGLHGFSFSPWRTNPEDSCLPLRLGGSNSVHPRSYNL